VSADVVGDPVSDAAEVSEPLLALTPANYAIRQAAVAATPLRLVATFMV
jgi:hypothetical protein